MLKFVREGQLDGCVVRTVVVRRKGTPLRRRLGSELSTERAVENAIRCGGSSLPGLGAPGRGTDSLFGDEDKFLISENVSESSIGLVNGVGAVCALGGEISGGLIGDEIAASKVALSLNVNLFFETVYSHLDLKYSLVICKQL